MEFQILSASLKDAFPPAYDGTKEDLYPSNFFDLIESIPVKKREQGCILFLFGRFSDGRSVCVSVQGVHPRLYFKNDGTSAVSLKRELTREVRGELLEEEEIRIIDRKFAHFSGFEPNASSPSGRCVHAYFQAEYPSLRAYRKAEQNRRSSDASHRQAHELHVDPMVEFFRDKGLVTGGWVKLRSSTESEVKVTTCDVEVDALSSWVEPLKKDSNAPYRVLYHDIETLGTNPEDAAIIQWSLVFDMGNDVVEKHIVAVGSVAPMEHVHVHS